MRTPEQIENLRKVLCYIVGPYAPLMTDEEIDIWADNLEKQAAILNNIYWKIQIRFEEDKNKLWSQIKPEPRYPHFSLNEMKTRCNILLAKHEIIDAIRISDRQNPANVFLFERKEEVASET